MKECSLNKQEGRKREKKEGRERENKAEREEEQTEGWKVGGWKGDGPEQK